MAVSFSFLLSKKHSEWSISSIILLLPFITLNLNRKGMYYRKMAPFMTFWIDYSISTPGWFIFWNEWEIISNISQVPCFGNEFAEIHCCCLNSKYQKLYDFNDKKYPDKFSKIGMCGWKWVQQEELLTN